MDWTLTLFTFAILLIGRTTGWHFTPSEDLQQVLATNEYILVAFVAHDEQKSKAFETEWNLAVSEGKGTLVSVDCATHKEACEGHGVVSYPEVVLFQNGESLSKYLGAKRSAAILHFVARHGRPVVSHLPSSHDLTAFKTSDETVFVAYYSPEDTLATRVFAAVAERYRDEFSFGAVTDAGLADEQKMRETRSIICYKVVDGDTVLFSLSGYENVDDMQEKLDDWIQEASRPVIGELNEWTKQRFLDRGWPMVYLFAPTEAARAQLRISLYRFARSYYDSLTVVVVDPAAYPGLIEGLGLLPNVFPAGAVHQLSKDRVYPYPQGQPFDSNALQKWGLDVWQGRIKPWTPPAKTGTARKLDIKSIPGVKIKVAGHDEL